MCRRSRRPTALVILALSGLSACGTRAGAVTAPQDPSMPSPPPAPVPGDGPTTALRFEVAVAPGLAPRPLDGRLFVVLGSGPCPEPRFTLGRDGPGAVPALARDARKLAPGAPAVVDASATSDPVTGLAALPPGTYHAQAVLDTNPDSADLNAPGNLVSGVREVPLDPARGGVVRLELSRRLPPETVPPDTHRVKYLKLPSPRLSAFHGRPMFLRAGVILPRGFDREPARRYPLRVHIGGFATRYTAAGRMMAPGAPFRAAWDADGAPRFLLVHLDGDGPLGDPYQVNSANHGPYGDAITRELIPEVERRFRGLGGGAARVLDGSSTGGWVALALQVYYPESFHGCWSFCPDPVDFRSYERINIYEDANAYVDASGRERPASRDPATGRVRTTMRQECGLENLLGAGDRYTLSGGQWGAWNATFSPRGPDGLPVPLWDPRTGRVERAVATQWRPYDLRSYLQENWAALGPKLRGKLHIWVGEADDFYLDEAVCRLDAFLSRADPPYDGSITYGPGRGHRWVGLSERELLRQMGRAVAAGIDHPGAGGP